MSRNVEASYGLSPSQMGMLFHRLNAPRAAKDLFQISCRWKEAIDIAALRRAWQTVTQQHPTLRLAFRWEGLEEPVQDIYREVTVPFSQEDWRRLEPALQSRKLEEYLESDRREGFQADRPPLLRMKLFELGEADYTLVWTIHHALWDGRVIILVLKEAFEYYEAYQRGEEPQLQAPPRPYRDYVDWCREYDPPQAETFWRTLLRGFTAPTPLMVDKPADPADSLEANYGEQEVYIPEPATAALRTLASQSQVTMNTLVQAAWAVLLSRYSGEDDVVFGATRACRRSSIDGAADMIGVMVNTLPVRARVNPDSSLAALLKELREQHLQVRDYEHTPLTRIQRWSDLPGGAAPFETAIIFHNYAYDGTFRYKPGIWPRCEFRLYPNLIFTLNVMVYNEPQLRVKIIYDRSRLDDATIERMLGHVRTLLEGIAADPNQCLGDLPILTEAERRQLLVEWNNTATDVPHQTCIHQLFEQQVERTPTRVAVVFGDRRLTYRELNQRANQLAHYLRRLGVSQEVLVGVYMERSVEMIVGVLAILKAGGAYVPLDPNHPSSRVAIILEDAQLPAVLTQAHLASQLHAGKLRVIGIDVERDAVDAEPRSNPPVLNSQENLAYVLYTSGSTGRPKGVAIEHRSTVAFVHWAQALFTPEDLAGVLFSTSLCFDLSVFEIFVTLSTGGTLIGAQNALEFKSLPAAEQVTLINTVPSAMAELVRQGNWPGRVRTVNLAGEPLSNKLAQAVYAQNGVQQVYNLYGPTEATTYSTWVRVAKGANQEPTIGRPIANTQTYILDRWRQPVPIGVAAELYLGGAGLARGYWKQPDMTADRFVGNPFLTDPTARLYRTGDLARYLPDGNIEYLGRIDHQVKLRGFRIELGEIETVLGQHPAVRECVVLVREDEPGTKRLVAYCVPSEHTTPDALRSHLKERLPDYMVPSAFVMLDAFPLTPNGKMDRRALPAPDTTPAERDVGAVAPRTPVEKSLAAIWALVLRLERVGVHDNFFDLGGTSLDYFAVFNRIEQEFGRTLTVAAMRQAPTVERLAEVLAHPDGVPASLAASPRPNRLSRFLRQTRGWMASPVKTFLELSDRLYEVIVQNGPVPLKTRLPYGVGTRLLARCFGWRLTQDVLFRRSLRMLRECMPSNVRHPADLCARSLTSNIWFVWRMAALAHCTVEEFDRWVTVTGFSAFEEAHREGRGVVLVSSHAHMRRIIPWVLHRAGYANWGAVGIGADDGTLKAMGLRNAVHDPLQGLDIPRESYFAIQLYKAKQLLERGGIVQMAPDGHIGSDTALTIPFLDRHLTLRAGFAELALSTAAPVVAVSVSIEVSGHIKVEFFARLVVPDLGHRKQVKSLLLQYGEIFRKEWTDHYGTVNWAYLERFHRRLFPFRQQETTPVAAPRVAGAAVLDQT